MKSRILLIALIILLLLSAGLASASDRLIVDDFEDTYYMNDEKSIVISTTITIIGDDLKGSDVPVYVNFYDESGVNLFASYEIEDEIIAYQTGIDKRGHPVYKYKNYTDDFGFVMHDPGELRFRLVVNFEDFQDYNKVHILNVEAGRDPAMPDPDTNQKVISGMMIIILIVIVVISLSGAGVVVHYSRKDLSSKVHKGMDIEAGDIELVVELESKDDTFKKVPESRKIPVLKSQTSQSEIDVD